VERALLVDRQLSRGTRPNTSDEAQTWMIALGACCFSASRTRTVPWTLVSMGVERCVEAGAREALGGEMEDVVGLGVGHDVLDRHRVAQVAIEQRDSVAALIRHAMLARLSSGLRQRHIPTMSQSVRSAGHRPDASRPFRDACDEGAPSSHRSSILPSMSRFT